MADPQSKVEQTADVANRNPQNTGGSGQQQTTSAAERATDRANEATKRATETGADAARRTGELTAKSAKQGARATEAGLRKASELTREGAAQMGQGVDRIAQNTAEQLEQMGRLVGETTRDAAQMMRMMTWPASSNGVRDAQRAASDMLNRMVEANLQIAEETFRRSGPTELLGVQQRFIRTFLDTLTSGSADLLRAGQQIAEETQRSVEQRHRSKDQATGRGEDRGNRSEGRSEGQSGGTVGDVMARDVRIVSPDDTIQQVAQIMTEQDTGAVPVGENDRLVGMVSDREIAARLASDGRDPGRTKVRDVMSREVRYCFEDEELEHVAENMVDLQLRRLPVMNRDKRLVGVVSLGDMLARRSTRSAGRALQESDRQKPGNADRKGKETRQGDEKGVRQPA
jgi:CBS domain-containing protein